MTVRSKLPRVGTTIFTVMTDRARELGAINLAQGFPDYDAPEALKKLAAQHLAAGSNQYAPMIGVRELREQIALKVAKCY
ncbi:MAG TPA: methionine aminotransferase, partial [Steroidobacter sp.]|nr:methionine aminotransferase [Steroidobacter sp.]